MSWKNQLVRTKNNMYVHKLNSQLSKKISAKLFVRLKSPLRA